MKILALETTENIGSLAAMEDGKLLLERDLNPLIRSAQSLAPGMKGVLEDLGWRPADVGLVAVVVGPGSFTGLRVGVTAAKVFTYAVGGEVLGVQTLETIAAGTPADVDELSVAIDAQRGDVVSRSFRRDAEGWCRPTAPQVLQPIDAWLASLMPGAAVSGPILKKVANRVPNHARILEPPYWRARAAYVARLAARDYAAGRRDDLWTLSPRYFRRSAAEEKWEALGK